MFLSLLLARDRRSRQSTLPRDLVVDAAGDADAARLGQALQPRRDIDAVAVEVVALDDDVAEIDADAQHDTPRLRQVRIRSAIIRRCSSTAHVTASTALRELDQHAVAHQLDDAAVDAR